MHVTYVLHIHFHFIHILKKNTLVPFVTTDTLGCQEKCINEKKTLMKKVCVYSSTIITPFISPTKHPSITLSKNVSFILHNIPKVPSRLWWSVRCYIISMTHSERTWVLGQELKLAKHTNKRHIARRGKDTPSLHHCCQLAMLPLQSTAGLSTAQPDS